MKKLLYIVFILLTGTSFAQKVTTVPELFGPKDQVKITVDISQCDCKRLAGNAGPLYFWTWKPKDPPGGNGSWTDSNEDLKMTHEGGDKWSFTMTPTDFYQTTEDNVYKEDIYFLVKADDGSGAGGGGCDEDKTEDLKILVDPLLCKKMCSFPQSISDTAYITPNQPFSFLYDKSYETKANLMAASGYVVFARLWIEGEANVVNYVAPAQILSHPELEMTLMDNSTSRYQWTIIPTEFFKDKLAAYPGKKLQGLQIRVVGKKTGSIGNDDLTDDITNFYFIQE